MKTPRIFALILTAAALFAPANAAPAADVEQNWTTHCASCHGKDGKGKTKAGRIAGAKDLTDAAYLKQFTDEQIFEGIKKGRKDDKGKEKMKPFADKLNDEEITALVKHVRGLKP